MYRTRTITLVVASALVALVLVPATAGAVSREDVLARGRAWLNVGVPYSQGAYALENGTRTSGPTTSTPTAGYRTDCSGFVSMCWNLRNAQGKPYSTDTYSMGLNSQSTGPSTLFRLAPVSKGELLPGDILLKSRVWYSGGSGHVVVFAGWSKPDMSEYWALEQTSPKTKYSKRPWGQTGYRAFRNENVDGFDRSRVVYGTAFTVTGLATKTVVQSGVTRAVAATSGVVGLALSGAAGPQPLVDGVALDANGRYRIGHTPLQSGRYVVRYRAADSQDSIELIARDITVVPAVSTVAGASSKLRRKRTYGFYGYSHPRVGTTLTIAKYSKKKRAYLPYKNVKAKVSTSMTSRGYKFTAKWRPTVAGTYRITWTTGAPQGMAATVSGNRYVTVK